MDENVRHPQSRSGQTEVNGVPVETVGTDAARQARGSGPFVGSGGGSTAFRWLLVLAVALVFVLAVVLLS